MKELDIMLEAFLISHGDELQSGAHAQLEDFLASEDDLLWSWLQKLKVPENPEWRALVNLIRRGT